VAGHEHSKDTKESMNQKEHSSSADRSKRENGSLGLAPYRSASILFRP